MLRRNVKGHNNYTFLSWKCTEINNKGYIFAEQLRRKISQFLLIRTSVQQRF